MFGDVYNTEVYINGSNMYSSTYYPGMSCCCRGGRHRMNSCFDYGFNNFGFWFGASMGMTLPYVISALLNKNKN